MTKTALQTLSRYPWLLPLTALTAVLGAFGKLAEDVWNHEPFRWDVPLLADLHQAATPFWDRTMLALTTLGGAKAMALVAAGVLLWLIYRRLRVQAIFFTLAVGGAALLNPLLKQIFHRTRPDLWPQMTPEHDYSFPSGHAMGSLAVVGALVVLAWPTRWRWGVTVGGSLFVLGVGFSRLYLGVHFPSDVLAGWAAALVWVGGVALALAGYKYRKGISPEIK